MITCSFLCSLRHRQDWCFRRPTRSSRSRSGALVHQTCWPSRLRALVAASSMKPSWCWYLIAGSFGWFLHWLGSAGSLFEYFWCQSLTRPCTSRVSYFLASISGLMLRRYPWEDLAPSLTVSQGVPNLSLRSLISPITPAECYTRQISDLRILFTAFLSAVSSAEELLAIKTSLPTLVTSALTHSSVGLGCSRWRQRFAGTASTLCHPRWPSLSRQVLGIASRDSSLESDQKSAGSSHSAEHRASVLRSSACWCESYCRYDCTGRISAPAWRRSTSIWSESAQLSHS